MIGLKNLQSKNELLSWAFMTYLDLISRDNPITEHRLFGQHCARD